MKDRPPSNASCSEWFPLGPPSGGRASRVKLKLKAICATKKRLSLRGGPPVYSHSTKKRIRVFIIRKKRGKNYFQHVSNLAHAMTVRWDFTFSFPRRPFPYDCVAYCVISFSSTILLSAVGLLHRCNIIQCFVRVGKSGETSSSKSPPNHLPNKPSVYSL